MTHAQGTRKDCQSGELSLSPSHSLPVLVRSFALARLADGDQPIYARHPLQQLAALLISAHAGAGTTLQA